MDDKVESHQRALNRTLTFQAPKYSARSRALTVLVLEDGLLPDSPAFKRLSLKLLLDANQVSHNAQGFQWYVKQ